MFRTFVALSVTLVVTACATVGTMPVPSPTSPAPDAGPAGPTSQKPVIVALTDSADQQARAGRYPQAAAALERALRIEPRNAVLWHRLARLRYRQGEFHQAIQLAAKSNTLASDNRQLRAQNWDLIGDAYQRSGDRVKAREARKKADTYKAPTG